MTTYPVSLDTDQTLFQVANNASSTLVANMVPGDMSFSLSDGSTFPAGRQIVTINNEIIIVASRAGNVFTVEARGAFGTAASSHVGGDQVAGLFTANHYEALRDTVVDMQSHINGWRGSIESAKINDPNATTPVAGDQWVVAAGGVGDWSGQDANIARWNGAGWDFIAPTPGSLIYVSDESAYYFFGNANWQSGGSSISIGTEQSSNFTATLNQIALVDVSGGAVVVTVPASATSGQVIKVADSRGLAGTNNITVDLTTNGYKLFGAANDYVIDISNAVATLTYINAAIGWIAEK